MKKLAKSLGALLVAFSLIGCGNNDVPATDTTPTVENFNSDKYDLKIKSKYQSVGGKLDLSGGKKQHIRAARRLAVNNGVAEASGNSMVLSIDDEGIQTLMQLDPDLDVNSTGQAARILTAPEKSTLVEVVGTEKESTPANNAEGGESSDNSVVAPSKFQMVEYDANGTYGIDIGSEVYQKLDLSFNGNGVIQPRSIKTKDFTFSDATLNFATARSDVYFIKDGEYEGMSAEMPKDLWIPYYNLPKPEKCKNELYYTLMGVMFGYNSQQTSNKFEIDFEEPEYTEGVHKTHVMVKAVNGKFNYTTDVFVNIKYGDLWEDSANYDYPEVFQKEGATKNFYNDSTFQYSASYDYYYCDVIGSCDALDEWSIANSLESFKSNFDVYMASDLKKQTNMIDLVELMQYKDLPAHMQTIEWTNTFVIKIKNYYYITAQNIAI